MPDLRALIADGERFIRTGANPDGESTADLADDLAGLSDGDLGPLSAAVAANPAGTEILDGRYASRTALWLPGTAGSYVSTPDHADLDIVGDITLIAFVNIPTLPPAATSNLVTKWSTSGNQRSYRLAVNTSGNLLLGFSPAGAAAGVRSVNAGPIASGWTWVAGTLDADNGAGGNSIRLWSGGSGPTPNWTQLGSTSTAAGAWSTHVGTAPVELGSITAGTAEFLIGRTARAIVCDGIGPGGAPADFSDAVADWRGDTNTGPRYRDRTGKIWTINGSDWAWADGPQ